MTTKALRLEIETWLEGLTPGLEDTITFRRAPGKTSLEDLPSTGKAWEDTRQFHVVPTTDLEYGRYQGPGPEIHQLFEIQIRYHVGGDDAAFDLMDLTSDDMSVILKNLNTASSWSAFSQIIIRVEGTAGPDPTETEGIYITRMLLRVEYFRS